MLGAKNPFETGEVHVQMMKEAGTLVGEKLIRSVLLINAAGSAVCGLPLLAAAGAVSDWTGLESQAALRETGLFLIVVVCFLLWTATRSVILPRVVLAFAVIDELWVVGSAVVLGESGSALTAFGVLAIVLVAVAVGIFAVFEALYFWRNRSFGR